jgi:hypothetical protein
MALHQQGDAKPGREHLTQATPLRNQHLANPTPFPLDGESLDSQDWLSAWLSHCEARGPIEVENSEMRSKTSNILDQGPGQALQQPEHRPD